MAAGWTAPPVSSSPRSYSPAGRAFAGPIPGVLAHGSGREPPPLGASQGINNEAWWQPQQRQITVPRHIIERLRAVHLAQLEELSRLRVQVAQTRAWPLRHHQILDKIREAKRQEADITSKGAVATEEVSQNHEQVNLMRYNCVDLEAQLRASEAREAQLEERFSQRATRASEAEQGAVMNLEVSVVGIDLNELHDLEAVRLITRPIREAAAQTLGLARAASSCSLSEGVGRLSMHFRLPPDLRASPERFRTFKKHFVEAKQSGEFRARLEESLLELEDEFGTRVAVRSVSQPVLLDGAKVIVPEGAGAMGMVPEGHPPSLVTLWQVQPGSWAQKAGIQSGDTLLWLNDQPVTEIDVRVLADRMRNRRPLSLYIARPPGAHTTKAKEEAAARKIQAAFRKKLGREHCREARHRMNLAAKTREQERAAAAAAAAGQRKKQADSDFEQRRADKLARMANRPGVTREQEAATRIQAGFRGSQARLDTEQLRKDKESAGRIAQLNGVSDLLAGLGEYLDQNEEIDLEHVTYELETAERKLGIRTVGEPPNERVYVADITRGFWADQNEVQVGDEVIALNGAALSALPFEAFNQFLKVRPLKIQFQRSLPSRADPRQEAATKIQARFRGRKSRAETRSKQEELERIKQAEAREASRRNQAAAEADAAADRWVSLTVKPGAAKKTMGWINVGMAPDRMIVESIMDSSWAESVGIQVGDELVQIGGKEVNQLTEKAFKKLAKERPLELVFYRWGDIVGDAVPEYDGLDALMGALDSQKAGRQYTLKADLWDEKLGFAPGEMPPKPVIVAFVEPGGWAEQNGVQLYDELIAAQGQPCKSMNEKTLVKFMKSRPLELTFRGPGGGSEAGSGAASSGGGAARGRGGGAQGADARPAGYGEQYEVVAGEDVDTLGITPSAMPPDYVYVHLVEPGYWADMQGIVVGDAIVALNGTRTSELNARQFQKLMRTRPLTFTIEQGSGQPMGSGVAKGLRSKEGTMFELTVDEGVQAIGFTPGGLPPDDVTVVKVDPDSWAARNQLLEKVDTLVAIDGRDVSTMTATELRRNMSKRPVTLSFNRSVGPPPSAPSAFTGGYFGEEDGGTYNPGYGGGYDVDDPYGGGDGVEWEVTAHEEDGPFLGWTLTDPPEVFIADVQEDTWAWNNLQVDDQLLKVDGVDVAEMDEQTLRKALRVRPVTVTLYRYPHPDTGFDLGAGGIGATGSEKKKKKKKGKKERRDSDGYLELAAEAMGLDEDSDDPDVIAAKKKARKVKKATVTATEADGNLGFNPSGFPPERVYILDIAPFGFAEKKKLKVGDELVQVNGDNVADLNKKELKTAMKNRPLKLSFERKIKKSKDKSPRTPRSAR